MHVLCRKSVLEAPDDIFYQQPLLKPYVFFDVSHGREQRGGTGGGSLRNQVPIILCSYIIPSAVACQREMEALTPPSADQRWKQVLV